MPYYQNHYSYLFFDCHVTTYYIDVHTLATGSGTFLEHTLDCHVITYYIDVHTLATGSGTFPE